MKTLTFKKAGVELNVLQLVTENKFLLSKRKILTAILEVWVCALYTWLFLVLILDDHIYADAK